MGIENPVHLLFLGAVALIVLGPKRLPEVAKALGHGIREFREAINQQPDSHVAQPPPYQQPPPHQPPAAHAPTPLTPASAVPQPAATAAPPAATPAPSGATPAPGAATAAPAPPLGGG